MEVIVEGTEKSAVMKIEANGDFGGVS